VPRIEHRDMGLVEVAGVARDDRQTVMQCGPSAAERSSTRRQRTA
jgi:hypothetical protein